MKGLILNLPYLGDGANPAVTGFNQVKASVSNTHKSFKDFLLPSQPPCITILRPTNTEAWFNLYNNKHN